MVQLRSRHGATFYAQTTLVVPLLLTTVVAGAIGGGEGIMLTKFGGSTPIEAAPAKGSNPPAPEASAAKQGGESHEGKPKSEHGAAGEKAPAVGIQVRDLAPIVTNIAMPDDVWIRLETSVVYDAAVLKEPDVAVKEISGDILAYLKTLSLPQVQGSRGLRHLREDLNERASIRTEGKIKELLIQGMVIQ